MLRYHTAGMRISHSNAISWQKDRLTLYLCHFQVGSYKLLGHVVTQIIIQPSWLLLPVPIPSFFWSNPSSHILPKSACRAYNQPMSWQIVSLSMYCKGQNKQRIYLSNVMGLCISASHLQKLDKLVKHFSKPTHFANFTVSLSTYEVGGILWRPSFLISKYQARSTFSSR